MRERRIENVERLTKRVSRRKPSCEEKETQGVGSWRDAEEINGSREEQANQRPSVKSEWKAERKRRRQEKTHKGSTEIAHVKQRKY